MRDELLPLAFGKNAFGVVAFLRTCVKEGFPFDVFALARLRALAEEPEDACRVAVDDRVVHPDVLSRETVCVGVAFHHGAVADDEFDFSGFQIDAPQAVGVRIGGMNVLAQNGVGIAVAAARNAGKVQADRPFAVRRDGVNGQFIASDDSFAELVNPRDEPSFALFVIVEDEAVRTVFEEEFHAALLVTPRAGGDQRFIMSFQVDQSDFRPFSACRQPLNLRGLHDQMLCEVAVPRVPVIISEEIVSVVGRQFSPVVLAADLRFHFALLLCLFV